MNSKSALEYLTSKTFTGGNPTLESEAKICAGFIKQDLDRLENVESNYKFILKRNEKRIDNLCERNQTLEKVVDILVTKLHMELEVTNSNIHFIKYDTFGSALITKNSYQLLKEYIPEIEECDETEEYIPESDEVEE